MFGILIIAICLKVTCWMSVSEIKFSLICFCIYITGITSWRRNLWCLFLFVHICHKHACSAINNYKNTCYFCSQLTTLLVEVLLQVSWMHVVAKSWPATVFLWIIWSGYVRLAYGYRWGEGEYSILFEQSAHADVSGHVCVWAHQQVTAFSLHHVLNGT